MPVNVQIQDIAVSISLGPILVFRTKLVDILVSSFRYEHNVVFSFSHDIFLYGTKKCLMNTDNLKDTNVWISFSSIL